MLVEFQTEQPVGLTRFRPGEVADLPDEKADRLIQAGVVKAATSALSVKDQPARSVAKRVKKPGRRRRKG